jgi:ATP-dependent DNA helicase RecG
LNVGLIHGRLKAEEKEAVMRDFRNHEYHILVSTTVIEVGVDIPDASIILIESANFFGLAQLHQLRGRVGRNDQDAYCFLIPQDNTAIDNERLKAMTDTHDGFKLAEIDLAQRGPGEFLGTRQSGYAGFRFATLADTKLIEKCRHAMGDIIKKDPSLSNPSHQLLKEELQNRWPEADFEFRT